MTHEARSINAIAADMRRIQDRQQQSLPYRLKNALARAAVLSTVSSSHTDQGYTTAGKTGSKYPPGFNDKTGKAHTNEFNAEPFLTVLEHHIERLELAIDAEYGQSPERHHAGKDGDALDEEIRSWAGVLPWVVATKAPHLGSPRTIERRRIHMGLRPKDGKEQDEAVSYTSKATRLTRKAA